MSTKSLPDQKTSRVTIEPWNVILGNDDWHTFEEVIIQLVRATSCSVEKAAKIAYEVHTLGEAICYTGSRERCELVAEILLEIKLSVRVEAV